MSMPIKTNKKKDVSCPDEYNTERINSLAKRLKANPLGEMLIEMGILLEAQIYLTNTIETAGYYTETVFGEHEIHLNAECDDHTLFVALAHELRHLEQRITLDCTLHDFSMEEAITLNRYLEADASVYSNAVAVAEFEKTGDKAFLKASEVYAEQDIMLAFRSMLTPGKEIAREKNAFRAGFNAWFSKKKRVKHYDKAVRDNRKEFNENVFANLFYQGKKRKLSKTLLTKIGAIKPRVNYLTGKGAPDLMSAAYRAGKPA